jgi:hypothetical protein
MPPSSDIDYIPVARLSTDIYLENVKPLDPVEMRLLLNLCADSFLLDMAHSIKAFTGIGITPVLCAVFDEDPEALPTFEIGVLTDEPEDWY